MNGWKFRRLCFNESLIMLEYKIGAKGVWKIVDRSYICGNSNSKLQLVHTSLNWWISDPADQKFVCPRSCMHILYPVNTFMVIPTWLIIIPHYKLPLEWFPYIATKLMLAAATCVGMVMWDSEYPTLLRWFTHVHCISSEGKYDS